MKRIRRWVQILAYISWGIPWRRSDYRHELLNTLQKLAYDHGLSITTIGSSDIRIRLGILEVEIRGGMPPVVVQYWVTLDNLAMMGPETSNKAYLYFKSETRFEHLVQPKALAHLILQQARALTFNMDLMRTQSAA